MASILKLIKDKASPKNLEKLRRLLKKNSKKTAEQGEKDANSSHEESKKNAPIIIYP